MRQTFAYISLTLVLLSLAFTRSDAQGREGKRDFVVVIDAGHGGKDPGAVGKKAKEKNINLSVALKTGKMIQDNCPGTKVVYTRSNDTFIPLHRRAEIANNAKADLFISIHTNSVASRNAAICGAETYTLGLHRTQENLEVAMKENSVILTEDGYKEQYSGFNPNSSESYIIFEFMQDQNMSQSVGFAKMIQRQFSQTAKRVDKGVHQAGFLVLRETSMPSVLVELGYITNANEEAYLMSEKGSTQMAESIYRAFRQYREGKTPERLAPDNSASSTASPAPAKPQAKPTAADLPVFKIQILLSDKKLPENSKLFKGLSPVSYYKENGVYKYTYCEDTNYNNVLKIKREKVNAKFKDCFIIAFKNGKKINVNEAINEFKRNR